MPRGIYKRDIEKLKYLGHYVRTEESRKHQSDAQKKRFTDPEQRKLLTSNGYKHFPIGHKEHTKGKTLVEIYGEERAKEIYLKVSINPKEIRSKKMKAKWKSREFRDKVYEGQINWWRNTEEGKKQRILTSETMKNTMKRQLSNPNSVFHSAEYKKKISDSSKKMWQNPEYVRKLMLATKVEPNKKKTIIRNYKFN